MDKENMKKIFCELIDSVDDIREFSISNEIEETDISTLAENWVVRRPTGITNVNITVYKEHK